MHAAPLSQYGWRGADTDPFSFLARCVAPARVRELTLSLNFRCPQEVIVAAAAVLRCADDCPDAATGSGARTRKRAAEPSLGSCAREQIMVIHAQSEHEQQFAAATRVRALQRQGVKLSEIALLCRLNRQADALRRVLDVEYKMGAVGGSSLDLATREQLAPLLSYLKLAIAPEQNDDAFWKVLNVPSRGLGAAAEAYLRCAHAKVAELAPSASHSAIGVLEALARRGCYPKLPVVDPSSIYGGGGAGQMQTASKPRLQALPSPAQAAVQSLCAIVRELESALKKGASPTAIVDLLLARVDFVPYFKQQARQQQQQQQSVQRAPVYEGTLRSPKVQVGAVHCEEDGAMGAFAPRGGASSAQPAALTLIRQLAAEYTEANSSGAASSAGVGLAVGSEEQARGALARLVEDALLAEASGEVDALGGSDPAADGGPMVTTIHGAKGREWAHVVVCFADEGVLPLRARGEQSHALLREEARLTYVAMTRARKSLAFTCGAQPSRFVLAIPETLLQHVKHAEPPPVQAATAAVQFARAGHTVTTLKPRNS